MLHACFVRSPFARARIVSIDAVGGARTRRRPRRVHRRRPQSRCPRSVVRARRQGRPGQSAPAARRGRGALRRRPRRARRRRRSVHRRGRRRPRRRRVRPAAPRSSTTRPPTTNEELVLRRAGPATSAGGWADGRPRSSAPVFDEAALVVDETIYQQAYVASPMETRGIVVEWSRGRPGADGVGRVAVAPRPADVRRPAPRRAGEPDPGDRPRHRRRVRPEDQPAPRGHLHAARGEQGARRAQVHRGPPREPDGEFVAPRARHGCGWRSTPTARTSPRRSTSSRTSVPTRSRGRSFVVRRGRDDLPRPVPAAERDVHHQVRVHQHAGAHRLPRPVAVRDRRPRDDARHRRPPARRRPRRPSPPQPAAPRRDALRQRRSA